MTIVISHAHFYRSIYEGSYTEIFKALCTKNNIPYVSPIEENLGSNAIIQKLSEQEVQGNIASETECEISNSEDEESNSKTESENEESPMEEDQYWKRETRTTSRAKQINLRDLSQEKTQPQQPKPSSTYANAASK